MIETVLKFIEIFFRRLRISVWSFPTSASTTTSRFTMEIHTKESKLLVSLPVNI